MMGVTNSSGIKDEGLIFNTWPIASSLNGGTGVFFKVGESSAAVTTSSAGSRSNTYADYSNGATRKSMTGGIIMDIGNGALCQFVLNEAAVPSRKYGSRTTYKVPAHTVKKVSDYAIRIESDQYCPMNVHDGDYSAVVYGGKPISSSASSSQIYAPVGDCVLRMTNNLMRIISLNVGTADSYVCESFSGAVLYYYADLLSLKYLGGGGELTDYLCSCVHEGVCA